jgi:hypothetical protein
MKTILLAAAFVAVTLPALACDDQTIEHITPSGIIELDDGTEWEVTSGNTSGFNEGDDVLVCNDTMTNKDDGEQISVSQR